MPLPGAWDVSSIVGCVEVFGFEELAVWMISSKVEMPKYEGLGSCRSRIVCSSWERCQFTSFSCRFRGCHVTNLIQPHLLNLR